MRLPDQVAAPVRRRVLVEPLVPVAAVGVREAVDDRAEVVAEVLPQPGDDPLLVVADRADGHFLVFSDGWVVDRAAMKASGGTSTVPMFFIRFLPAFCFSSSLRLRVMSPP